MGFSDAMAAASVVLKKIAGAITNINSHTTTESLKINSDQTTPLNSILKNSTYGLPAIMNAVNEGSAAVKSIQSGDIWATTATRASELMNDRRLDGQSASSSHYSYYFDVTFSSVDVSKCVINLSSYIPNTNMYSRFVDDHTLRIYVWRGNYSTQNYGLESAIKWQVVEFY